MVEKIILVFKTHFDIGFTDLAANVVEQYAGKMLQEVLETCKSTEDMGPLKYVWPLPAWPLKIILERCRGKQLEDLEHYIKNGQIAWHALPFTSHTDFCGEEEYLEGLRYGRMLSEKYEKPYPIAAKMTDVPGHGFMLPELLSASGIPFLHLGCNEFATPPRVPDLFFWEAPSGRKVLTMYSKGGYGSGLKAPEDWNFPVWMAMMHTHDNSGPHSARLILEMAEQAKKLYPNAQVVCGTMDDFYRELSKHDLSHLPVVQKDLADTWIHGVGSYPEEAGRIREMRRKSIRLQKLNAMSADSENSYGERKKELLISDYYEHMHLFGEHTWGADVKTWLGPQRVFEKESFKEARGQENYRFMEKSWQEQRNRANCCMEDLQQYKEQLELQKGEQLSFFNPNAMPFTGWVPLKEYEESLTDANLEINGTPMQMGTMYGTAACFVEDLLPLQTTPVTIQRNKIQPQPVKEDNGKKDEGSLIFLRDGENTWVENHRYMLYFDESSGIILRLFDKELDKNILESKDGTGILSYEYTRYGIEQITEFLRSYGYRFSTWGIQDYGRENYPECKNKTFHPRFRNYKIEVDTITFYYENDISADCYGDAREIIIEITMPKTGDELFAAVHLKGKQETPFVESGTIRIPLGENPRHFRINKSGVVIDPAQDIIEDGNHVFYALENFAAASYKDAGVCIVPWDTPLMSIGENGVYQYRHQYEQTRPVMCFNLYNNMWGTNFPQWIGGDFTYRFLLFGYKQEEEKALMERCAYVTEGIEVTELSVNPNSRLKLPEHMQLMNIKREGKGYFIWLRDVEGAEADCTLELPGYRITPVDYYMRRTAESREEKLSFLKKPFGIASFYIEQQ